MGIIRVTIWVLGVMGLLLPNKRNNCLISQVMGKKGGFVVSKTSTLTAFFSSTGPSRAGETRCQQ